MDTLDSPLLDIFASTYSLFQLFEEVTSNTHPSPVLRQSRLGLMCHYLALSYSMQLRHNSATMVGGVMNNVDIYMNNVFGIDWSDRKEKAMDVLGDLSKNVMPISDEVMKNHAHFEANCYLDFPDFRCKVHFDDKIAAVNVDEIVVLAAETQCWKCNAQSAVVALVVTHDGKMGLLEYVESLPQNLLDYVNEHHPQYIKVMVDEVETACFSNNCKACGIVLKDFNLLQPNGLFLTEDAKKLAQIRKVTVACEGGEAKGCFGHGPIVDYVVKHAQESS